MSDIDNPSQENDICRVCQLENTPGKPLYYPCMCRGSIKFVHEKCLVKWLKFSGKKYCEICSHQFSFEPVYAPDMPQQLPIRDIAADVIPRFFASIKFFLSRSLVILTLAIFIPMTVVFIYKVMFIGLSEAVSNFLF